MEKEHTTTGSYYTDLNDQLVAEPDEKQTNKEQEQQSFAANCLAKPTTLLHYLL